MTLKKSYLLYPTNLPRAKFSQQNFLTLNQRHPNPNQPTNPTKKWHLPPKLPPLKLSNSNPVSTFRNGCGHFKQTFAVKHYKDICRRGGLMTALLKDAQWPLHQPNRTPNTNPALPDETTPRPNVAMPADHPANATNAVFRIYERAVAIHDACLNGLTTLLGAPIASIGPANALLLADPANGMLLATCVEIINTITVKHGTPPSFRHLPPQTPTHNPPKTPQ
jgi:hypothetical protein